MSRGSTGMVPCCLSRFSRCSIRWQSPSAKAFEDPRLFASQTKIKSAGKTIHRHSPFPSILLIEHTIVAVGLTLRAAVLSRLELTLAHKSAHLRQIGSRNNEVPLSCSSYTAYTPRWRDCVAERTTRSSNLAFPSHRRILSIIWLVKKGMAQE